MTIVINDPELYAKAERLAAAYQQPVERLVTTALRRTLREMRTNAPHRVNPEGLHALQDALAQLPVLDSRSSDELLGYNEFGHFD